MIKENLSETLNNLSKQIFISSFENLILLEKQIENEENFYRINIKETLEKKTKVF